MELMMESAYRRGEWLHVPVSPDGDAGELRAGSHAHETRLQLLALGLWPAKWINSLFSTGGIGWTPDGELRLRAFPAAEAADPLQEEVLRETGDRLKFNIELKRHDRVDGLL
ncbi:hypothetical protein BN871_JJ_00130, partial [Paenibacillus sp. P22]